MLNIKTYKCKNCEKKYNNYISKDKIFCSKDCRSTYYLLLYRYNNKKLIYLLDQ